MQFFCTDSDTLDSVSSDTSLSVNLKFYRECYMALETEQSICQETGLTKLQLRSKVKSFQ